MGQLDGKIAIITGAATGIGKGITFAYGKEGATLVMASRNEENLKNCAHEIESTGVNTLVIRTDISIEIDVINLFQFIIDMENFLTKYNQLNKIKKTSNSWLYYFNKFLSF